MDEPASESTPTATGQHGPVDGWTAPPPSPPRPRREKVALLIAGVFVLASVTAFVGGIVYTLFLAATAPPAVGALFGPPYEQLPADFRAGIDARLRDVAPDDWEQRTEAQRTAWATEQADLGLVRLEDATLVRLAQLAQAAHEQAPVAVCAARFRETRGGGMLSRATDEALQWALSPNQRMERVEIHIEAIEAKVHGTPVSRTVSDAEYKRVRDDIERLMTPEERRLVETTSNAPLPPSDIEICATLRALGAAALRLPAADRATYVRWANQP